MKRLVSILLLCLIGFIFEKKGIAAETEQSTNLSFPHFTWEAHPEAFKNAAEPVRYEIQIASDAFFRKIADQDEIYLNRYVPDQPLPAGKFYWRVRAVVNGKKGESWSKIKIISILPCDEIIMVDYKPGVDNHQPAVQAAIDKALLSIKEGRSVEVKFPKGIYRFNAPEKYFIKIKNAENLIINGNGAVVNILKFNLGFAHITESRNVIIRGFEVDYSEERTYVHGKITAVDAKSNKIEVQLEPASPTYDDAYVKLGIAHMSLLDPLINGRLKTNAGSFFRFQRDSTKKTGERKYSLKALGKLSGDFKTGDRFVDFLRSGGATSLCFAQGTENLTFYDITSYSSAGGHYVVLSSSVLNVLHCHARIKKGRWFGGNADGVHARGLKIGPWVEGCTFNGIGDDAIALYSRPMRAVGYAQGEMKETVLLRSEFFDLEEGDEVALFDPVKGEIFLETKVKSVGNDNKDRKVVFENQIQQPLKAGKSLTDDDQVWNRSKSCGDFVIRNNRFENIRRYGTVFRAKTGIVENNYYKGTSSSAIMSCNEPQFPNGLFCSDIIIINNKIKEFNFSTKSYAAITLALHSRQGQAMSLGPRNILIQNNQIEDEHRMAFQAENSENVVFRQNSINNIPLRSPDEQWVVLKNVEEIKWIPE